MLSTLLNAQTRNDKGQKINSFNTGNGQKGTKEKFWPKERPREVQEIIRI